MQELLPDDCVLEIGSIHEIPLYDGDLEEERGVPEPVNVLKDKIAASDGLILSTPEYNTGMPGVLKNTLDWLTRPVGEGARVFGDRPVALVGATPGGMGTASAQISLLPVLRALGTRTWCGKTLYVSGASKLFAEDGSLTDDKMRERVRAYLDGFVGFVRG